MRSAWTALIGGSAAVALCVASVAFGRQLGAREAREQLAALLGTDPAAVHVKSVTPGPIGSDAVVVAQVDLAFRMTDSDGSWRVADVRLGEGMWEDVELIRHAVDAEKGRRAAVDLRALAEGVEGYRRERGFLPEATDAAALVDSISPKFVARIIREDPWHRAFFYETVGTGYRLGSMGPDGRRGTGDDIVVSGEGKGA